VISCFHLPWDYYNFIKNKSDFANEVFKVAKSHSKYKNATQVNPARNLIYYKQSFKYKDGVEFNVQEWHSNSKTGTWSNPKMYGGYIHTLFLM
jgi:hypothetical protein